MADGDTAAPTSEPTPILDEIQRAEQDQDKAGDDSEPEDKNWLSSIFGDDGLGAMIVAGIIAIFGGPKMLEGIKSLMDKFNGKGDNTTPSAPYTPEETKAAVAGMDKGDIAKLQLKLQQYQLYKGPANGALDKPTIAALQQGLSYVAGYNGPADGTLNKATVSAMLKYAADTPGLMHPSTLDALHTLDNLKPAEAATPPAPEKPAAPGLSPEALDAVRMVGKAASAAITFPLASAAAAVAPMFAPAILAPAVEKAK